MKTYTYKNMMICLASVMTAGMLLAGQVFAAKAGVSVSSVPPNVDSVLRNLATASDVGGYVTVSFPGSLRSPSQPPAGAAADVRTSLMTTDGPFTGNYLTAGVQGLAFSIKYTGSQPPLATIVLVPEGGRPWYNRALLKFNAEENVWQENNVSFDLRSGWHDGRGNQSEANWQVALANVSAIGIDFLQIGAINQTASVDHFRLLLDNEVETPDAILSERLFDRFGVRDLRDLTEAQRSQDSDKNGIADYLEIWVMQSDPDSDEGDLMVEVHRTAEGRSEISWNTIAGGEYMVEVSDTPSGKYRALSNGTHVRASVKGREARTDEEESNGGLRFYRVKQFKSTL